MSRLKKQLKYNPRFFNNFINPNLNEHLIKPYHGIKPYNK